MSTQHTFVIALFPCVTHLDFTGPHQFFCRVPNAKVIVASSGGVDVSADGLVFADLEDLGAIEECDTLCVPGGFGVIDAIQNLEFMGAVKRLAAKSTYITSVCSGSIILAAAGLLKGKRAACHWAWRPLLAEFPDVTVANDRVVRDGNTFTGGGVTAGIDMALTLIAELADDEMAQTIQLGLEYAPEPPFNTGRPELAPAHIVAYITERFGKSMDKNKKIVGELSA